MYFIVLLNNCFASLITLSVASLNKSVLSNSHSLIFSNCSTDLNSYLSEDKKLSKVSSILCTQYKL